MDSPTAFITGITGQDGSYLAERLLRDGYVVHGLVRNADSAVRLCAAIGDAAARQVRLHVGDLADSGQLAEIVTSIAPSEIYNLGAQSHVRDSFDSPARTLEVNAGGTLTLLEAARQIHFAGKSVRVFQAVSSEIFDCEAPLPWSESTTHRPRSPYGCAKACAYQLVVTYRETYGLFACNGILFNHESPRRGETFVTRKITRAATRIREGLQPLLELGNIDVARDWGDARDYAECMRLMLRHDMPGDYVVATGQSHTLREFLDIAFCRVGLNWHDYVTFPAELIRPHDVPVVAGDPSKVKAVLGWNPSISFEDLVVRMVDHDWELARTERNRFGHHAA